MHKKHIFLNGFMGAGKSKIGPLLAEKLKMVFKDLDKEIEHQAGKSVSEIFNDTGEQSFRQQETAMLRQLINNANPSVISLGGGALVNPKNKRMVEEKGLVIYLKCSPEVIFERVKKSGKRPLLNIPRDEHFEERLLNKIKTLLNERSEIYESAQIIIERDGFEPPEVTDMIVNRLNEGSFK